MPRHPRTLLFPLFALFMVSANLSADEVAEAALRYAQGNRTLAVAAITRAERQVRETQAEVAIAHDIEREARRLGDHAALAVAHDAIAEGELGLREANLLLARAQSLLAQREQTLVQLRAALRNGVARGGVVVVEGGEVRRYAADGTVAREPSGPLRAGETLRTGPGGAARLFLAEGRGQVQLMPEGEFTLDEGDSGHDFLGTLKQGMVRLVAQLKLKERFEVRTPAAVCAVRGTDFAVEIVGAETRVRVFSGVVAVTATADGQTIEVRPGQQWSSGAQRLESFDLRRYPSPSPSWGENHAAP